MLASLLASIRRFFTPEPLGESQSVAESARNSKPVREHSLPEVPQAAQENSALNALVGIGSRRPVISDSGEVIGYEFCVHADVLLRLSGPEHARKRLAYVVSVLTSARLISKMGKVGFARLPAHWLDEDMALGNCHGVWVGVESPIQPVTPAVDPGSVARCLGRLKEAGAKVGWAVTFVGISKSEFGLVPDFVLLHQGGAPISGMLAARKHWPQDVAGLPVVATDLASEEDLELALQGGIAYVCGAYSRSAAVAGPVTGGRVPPDVLRLNRLMGRLISDADLPEIVDEIKGDVGLSYRLLGMMKSAKFANLQAGASVEQAVRTLGRDELYRSLSVMLLRYSGKRKVSSALEEIALWRARFLELLAIDQQEFAPGQFFTLGLVSMLGPILKLEPAQMVQGLVLPEPARQALLDQSGPWHAYLQVAMAFEGQTLDPNDALTVRFSGMERIREMSDSAWTWAAEHAQR